MVNESYRGYDLRMMNDYDARALKLDQASRLVTLKGTTSIEKNRDKGPRITIIKRSIIRNQRKINIETCPL